MNRFISFLILITVISSCSNYNGSRFSGERMDHVDDFPTDLVTPRDIDIWLPPGYDTNETYQVLYMNDGQMLFDGASTWNHQEWMVDETMTKLIAEDKINPCIVVGISSIARTRNADYFPQKPLNFLDSATINSVYQKVLGEDKDSTLPSKMNSDAYLQFIVEQLKPYIDEHYSTKTDAQHTFIAGASMGGLISMYALCEYPDVFGGAICMSTHWPGVNVSDNDLIPRAFAFYLMGNLPKPGNNKIYFDFGTETLDKWYEEPQLLVDSVLEDRGYGPWTWMTKKYEGHEHSEKSWQKRLHIPLEFMLAEPVEHIL